MMIFKNFNLKYILWNRKLGEYGLDDTNNFEKIISARKNEQNDFIEASFMQQFEELKGLKEKVESILK